jgi:hypothetical protein
MADERLADGRAAGDDVEDTAGQSGLLDQFPEQQRRKRRQRARQDHRRAAGRQRRAGFRGDVEQRIVVGADGRDHPDRLGADDAWPAGPGRAIAQSARRPGR